MKPQKISQQDHDDHPGLKQPGSQSYLKHDDHFDSEPHLTEFTNRQIRSINCKGYQCLIGAFALHLVLGTFYLWGGISPYIASYLKQYDESVTFNKLAFVFPFLGLITNSVLSFGVKLAERVGYKPLILAGGCLISLAFLICSFITNFWTFVAVYCIFVGVPSGLVYMLPIICGWKYFPQYRGRVSGLIIAGYGFGSFIFNFVCLAVVNPNSIVPTILIEEDGHIKKYFGPEVYNKVPYMLRIISLSYFILTLIATFLVGYPRDMNIHQYQNQTINPPKQTEQNVNINTQCQTIKQGLLSRPFFYLLPMIVSSTMFGLLMANSYKIFGFQQDFSDLQLTIIGSIASVLNGCSRIIWACLMEKYGFKIVFNIIMIFKLICTISIGYMNNSFYLYLLIFSVTMCCEGGMFALFPAITGRIFGNKVLQKFIHIFTKQIGPIVYGILFVGIGLSNILSYMLMFVIEPILTFTGLFKIFSVINFFALCLGLTFKDYHTWTF